jgi:precorrin-6Y C5,15-methyltransferase (decarboxylating)
MIKLYVIGIGYKPFDKRTREILFHSEIILASSRLSDVFKMYDEFETVKERVKVLNNVDETIGFIKSEISKFKSADTSRFITLLASGDPMFFGIGRRAVNEFGKDMIEIIPDLSSIQLSFARIKEPWNDALLISLHGGPDPAKRRRLEYELQDIPLLLKRHNKIAILTDKENNPSVIAKTLNFSQITHNVPLIMYVCEKLGYPDEKITEGKPGDISKMAFAEPNVVIILKSEVGSQGSEIKLGLTEDEIIHSKGLITKDEVRAVTIHKLRLPQSGVFWDIGSGSGSVSIEAAMLCPELKIYALEKDKEQLAILESNRMRFDIPNIEIINGEAPDGLKDLPLPDRVFVGGSGGRLEEIIEFVSNKMSSGIIVLNAAKIETLNKATAALKTKNFGLNVSQVFVSRIKAIGDGNFLSALNPVFVIKGER